MKEALNKIVKSLNSDQLIIELSDEITCGIKLAFLRAEEFDKLYRGIHEKFIKTNKTSIQKKLLENELDVSKHLRKHLKNLIRGISSGSTEIKLIYNTTYKESIDKMITELFKIKENVLFKKK